MLGGLNRTSVGLKPEVSKRRDNAPLPPQSNQRGIETHTPPGLCFLHENLPQSNQRGIETITNCKTPWADDLASIEPAWD